MTPPAVPPRSTSDTPPIGITLGVIHSVDSDVQVVEIQWANGTSSELPLQDLGLLAVDDVWKGAQVTHVDLSNLGLQDSLVVLEPEYVVDATEVATAMAGLKPAPISALLHRLTAVSSTQAMVAGTLLNTAFDLLAADPDRTDEDVLQAAFSGRSLALSALAFGGISVEDLYQATAERLPALRSTLRGWSASEVVVEPYVISPVVGLQGRFDILVTGASSIELVEMKGGSPPRTGVRPSHLVQAACYALLHIAVMNRLPDSLWLWYVTDDTTPFREIDRRVLAQTVADVIHTRNSIVAQDRAIAGRRFDHLRLISGDMAGISSYDRNDADRFSEAYRGVDAGTRTVFQAWMAFVHAERWEQRMGELGTRARASLWRQTRDEKSDDPS